MVWGEGGSVSAHRFLSPFLNEYVKLYVGSAMVQVPLVSGPSPRKPRFKSRPIHVGFVVTNWHSDRFCSGVFMSVSSFCHHGMARPQVADSETASRYGG